MAEPHDRGAVEPRSQEAVERSQAAAGAPAGADDDGLWEFVVQGRLTNAGQPEASHKDLTCFPGRATERVQARDESSMAPFRNSIWKIHPDPEVRNFEL